MRFGDQFLFFGAIFLVLLISYSMEGKNPRKRGKWARQKHHMGSHSEEKKNSRELDSESGLNDSFNEPRNETRGLEQKIDQLKLQNVLTEQITLEEVADMKSNAKIIRKRKAQELGIEISDADAEALNFGDTLITPTQLDSMAKGEELVIHGRKRREAINQWYLFWPGGTIPYYIDQTLGSSQRRVLDEAMAYIQENTCIKFQQHMSPPSTWYLKVIGNGGGCWSYVGYLKHVVPSWRFQQLSLDSGCDTIATAEHELCHASGINHEQTRHDRDAYVTVNYGNIMAGQAGNFDKCRDCQTMPDFPYDYGSIMHYGAYAFSKNSRPTIEARNNEYQFDIGQYYTHLTFLDAKQINNIYCPISGAPSHNYQSDVNPCDGSQVVCKNGGYPNPNNCAVCICPALYSGSDCSQRPQGCGANLQATDIDQMLTSTGWTDGTTCVWHIESPPGTQIEYSFIEITLTTSWYGMCDRQFVEVRDENFDNTGPRWCDPVTSTQQTGWTSPSNFVGVILSDNIGNDAFTVAGKKISMNYKICII